MPVFKLTSQRLSLIVLIVAAVVYPLFLEPRGYVLRISSMVLIFAAMAQSWNIVGGLANQLSLGHAAYFGLGAYISTLMYLKLGVSPWLGMIMGALLTGLAATALSIPLFRLKGHYFALAMLAFAEVLKLIANSWTSMTEGPMGITIPFRGADPWNFQFASPVSYYWVFLGMLLICSGVFHYFATGARGYRLKAIRENEAAAEVAGVNTYRIKLHVSTVSAMLTAMCGTMFAQFVYFFDPESVFSLADISIRMAMICIIGGMGTTRGPIIGALFLIPFEEFAVSTFSSTAAGLAQLIFGLVLMAAIILEPRGLTVAWKKLKACCLERVAHREVNHA